MERCSYYPLCNQLPICCISLTGLRWLNQTVLFTRTFVILSCHKACNCKTERVYLCRKSIGPEIFSMLFGCLIFLWRESKAMGNGLYFVQVRLLDWQIAGVMILRSCIRSMKER